MLVQRFAQTIRRPSRKNSILFSVDSTKSLPGEFRLIQSYRDVLRDKVVQLCAFIREVVTRAHIFVNGYVMEHHFHVKNFWYHGLERPRPRDESSTRNIADIFSHITRGCSTCTGLKRREHDFTLNKVGNVLRRNWQTCWSTEVVSTIGAVGRRRRGIVSQGEEIVSARKGNVGSSSNNNNINKRMTLRVRKR